MESSEIQGLYIQNGATPFPDFAALHPGYEPILLRLCLCGRHVGVAAH
jgi:hypothetical protein